jgi:hypothetical protein
VDTSRKCREEDGNPGRRRRFAAEETKRRSFEEANRHERMNPIRKGRGTVGR